MASEALLDRFKARIGKPEVCDTPTLSLYSDLIDEAGDYILGYTGRAEIPDALISAQLRVAVINYNRMGLEGDRAITEGATRHDIEALPADIERLLNQYRVVKIIDIRAAGTRGKDGKHPCTDLERAT